MFKGLQTLVNRRVPRARRQARRGDQADAGTATATCMSGALNTVACRARSKTRSPLPLYGTATPILARSCWPTPDRRPGYSDAAHRYRPAVMVRHGRADAILRVLETGFTQHKNHLIFPTPAPSEIFLHNSAATKTACPSGIHHGSLDRQTQRVEARLLRGGLRAICCTGSSILGVDWGDVDL